MNGLSVVEALAHEGRTSVKSQVCVIGGIPYDCYVRIRRGRWSMIVRAHDDRLCVEAAVRSSIVFAGGLPGLMTRQPLPDAVGVPLYRSDSDRFDPRIWLADHEHRGLVNALPLSAGRRLEVARNLLSWHGWAQDFDAGSSLLDQVARLAEALPPDIAERREIKGVLPSDLEILRELIPKWALSDDDAREGRVTGASASSLHALWKKTAPRLGAIDRFIEQAGPSSTEDAALLGDLAQAALEARAELEARGIASDG
jgi:hypothetical protein